jgi:hypothetical protein
MPDAQRPIFDPQHRTFRCPGCGRSDTVVPIRAGERLAMRNGVDWQRGYGVALTLKFF